MSLHPDITTDSPFGPARVWATSATHIGAEIIDGTPAIHGVRYRARLDLHLRDGSWQRGYVSAGTDSVNWESVHHALYLARVDDWDAGRQTFKPAPSAAARAKVLATFEPWLVEFAESDAGRELVARAADFDRQNKIDRIAAKRAILAAELAAIDGEPDAGNVGTFMDPTGTRGVMIDGAGRVAIMERATPADTWSPPVDCEPVR